MFEGTDDPGSINQFAIEDCKCNRYSQRKAGLKKIEKDFWFHNTNLGLGSILKLLHPCPRAYGESHFVDKVLFFSPELVQIEFLIFATKTILIYSKTL